MRIALVHDDLTQRGGAERVVLSLARLWPDAPIFTTIYDPDGTFPEFGSHDVRTGFLQRLGGAAPTRALLPLYPAAIMRIDLAGFDAVVSSSSRFAHGVRVPDGVHVCYCHNPARFLYQRDEYFRRGGPVPSWSRRGLAPLLTALTAWDRRAAARPDRILANSQVVADRIDRLWDRRAVVVHPPVDVARFASRSPAAPDAPLLVVSRLLGYKRVDVAVSVATEDDLPLVVVGEGPARSKLEAMAGPTVQFAGGLEDDALARCFARCRAVIHLAEEDFGIVPLEANAAGRPVIALGRGGALETVVPRRTGLLVPEATPSALRNALIELEHIDWSPSSLLAHAERFGEARFHARIRTEVASALDDRRDRQRTE